jgi:hypothetical protein
MENRRTVGKNGPQGMGPKADARPEELISSPGFLFRKILGNNIPHPK